MDEVIVGERKFEGHRIPTSNTCVLLIKGTKGFLGCGYVNVQVADKVGDAAAIVTGVKNYDDMLRVPVVAVSRAAAALGIVPGMSGKDALLRMS